MARSSRRTTTVILLALLAPLVAQAQLSSVPNLATATQTISAAPSEQTTSAETAATATSSDTATASVNTKTTTAGTSQQTTSTANDETTTSATFALTGAPDLTTTSVYHLSGIPTIAGAGIPELVIPWTGGAPFMQKSSLPQGTFFIAVGATLAFLGACVLLWRAMVAWSINRSVKRTASASMGARSEKTGSSYGNAWSGSYNRKTSAYSSIPSAAPYYKQDAGSSMSLNKLTSAGKTVKPKHRDTAGERNSQSLFFSPTAQTRDSGSLAQRNSSGYMPSGYYASPSAQNLTSIAPYAGRSLTPESPGLPPYSRGSRAVSRDGNGDMSDPNFTSGSFDGRSGTRDLQNRSAGYPYAQQSRSSLMVGQSESSRAPSAYLEDLFDNHGGARR